MRQHTSFSSTLAMALLMAVGASFISCPAATAQSKASHATTQGKAAPATAQTKAAAAATQAADASDDRVEARPADVSGLAGKKIDYASYKNYVTTGRPEDDGDKVFLLYNVGTGKFLNVGSYWGTHAALSNVPRPFWFQHRNEKRVAGQWAYNRFPESADADKGYFYNDFFALTTLQVGNTEGKKRSHVKYEFLRVVDAKTGATVEDIIPEGTNASGDAYSFMKELKDFDFNKYSIVARLDMSNCTATSSGGGNMETLLSFGQDVSKWSYDVSDLHIYGFRSGGKSYLRVQPMDGNYSDATHKSGGTENPIEIGDNNIVDITVAQQSIRINGVQCMPRTYTYDSAIKPVYALSTFNVGSTQGTVRTNATYNYVTLNSFSVYDSDESHIVRPGLLCNGRSFYREYKGTLDGKEIEATIDLTTCKNTSGADENIISFGTDIYNWFTSGDAASQNIHVYYNGSRLDIEGVSTAHTGSGSAPTIKFTKTLTPTTITLKLNRSGLFLDGTLVDGFGPESDVVKYLLTKATKIAVGNVQDENNASKRSYATYKSTTITVENNNVIEPGTTLGGQAVVKTFSGNMTSLVLEADIDLSTCNPRSANPNNKPENVFSIGTKIAKWGTDSGEYNVHMYYAKGESTVEVDPVCAGDKSRVYITVDEKAPKLYVKFSKDGLFVNGEQIVDNAAASKKPIAYLISSATAIEAGTAEGAARSHATYNLFTVKSAAAAESGEAAAAPATAQAAAKTAASKATAKPLRAEAAATSDDGATAIDLLPRGTKCNGAKVKSETFSIGFADSDYLEADIDLEACKDEMENVFSIGNAIDDWGNRTGQHNIHFYWIKRTTLDDGREAHMLQVAYVNNDHPDDFKRAVYVPVGETLHIRFSKDGLIVNGRDIYPAHDPMPHLTWGQYSQYAGEIVRVKQDEYGNRLLDDDGHFIIDMENGHGVKSSYNGYIYTTESRTAKSMPLFISSRFKQETVASGNEDVFFAWAPHLVNNNKWGTIGVFADRALPSAELTAEQSTACSQWYFEEAPGSTDGNHMYRIYLKMENMVIHDIDSNGKLVTKVVSGSQNFYLQADADEMLGNSYEHYPDGSDLSALTSVEAKAEMPATAENAYWKVFTMNEYYKMFKSEKSEMTSMLDLTFLMRDASFSRENAELSAWKADGDFSDNRLRIGYDHYSKKTTADTDYSDDNGKLPVKGIGGVYDYTGVESQYSALKNRTNNHARYMGVDVRGGANGKFYQDVTVSKQGWYAVTCGGMSNAGAQLFVQQVKKDGSVSAPVYQKLYALTADDIAMFNGKSQKWPFDYVEGGMPMYNALVAINDDAIQPNFKQQYTTQVAFFADPDVLADGGGSITLRVGVEIPPVSAASTQAADDATSDRSDRWTVFDDFHLLFGGLAQEPNLMLSEDFTSMDYLDETAHVFNLHPMRLHRTFTGGKWNTLILPVNLSKSDFTSMFGSTARLAQLDHLTATTVEFVSAPENGLDSETGTDFEGNATSKDIYLRAFKPYIIWVDEQHTHGNGKVDDQHPDGDGLPYTAPLAYRANTSTFNTSVSVPAEHFYLASATLAARHSDDAGQFYYSFRADTEAAKDIEFPFATAHTTGDLFTYRDAAAATDATGTNAPLRAYGSLCMNYDADNMTILDGRPTLGGGYVMSNGTMRRVKSRYGTKGLRCWFMPESADGQQLTSNVKVAIDGVEDTTTSISDLFADEPAAPARFADGIYNAAGQKIASSTDSTSQLAPGLYIVGGRKFVKK